MNKKINFDKPFLIVIVGPTAVGKTNNAIELAQSLNAEIISADSMQIYKYMNIGTAKPSFKDRNIVNHHLIDIVKPDYNFTVVDYKKLAEKALKTIYKNNKMPILVGGTGFYIKSVIDNYLFPEAYSDENYRSKLKRIINEKGSKYLHNLLLKFDLFSYNRIHSNDVKRIIRAFEIYAKTGNPPSYYESINMNITSPYNLLYIGLQLEREKLYRIINQRVDKMIEQGLYYEVIKLLDKGYSINNVSMKGLGYRQIIEFINGQYSSFEEATETIKKETRRYAKRQYTWFKRDNRINWINAEQNTVLKYLKDNFDYLQENHIYNRINK